MLSNAGQRIEDIVIKKIGNAADVIEDAVEVGAALLEESEKKDQQKKEYSAGNPDMEDDFPIIQIIQDSTDVEIDSNPFAAAAYNGFYVIPMSDPRLPVTQEKKEAEQVIEIKNTEEDTEENSEEEDKDGFEEIVSTNLSTDLRAIHSKPRVLTCYGAMDDEDEEVDCIDEPFAHIDESQVPDEGILTELNQARVHRGLCTRLMEAPKTIQAMANHYFISSFIELLGSTIQYNKNKKSSSDEEQGEIPPSIIITPTGIRQATDESKCVRYLNAVFNNCIVFPFLMIFTPGIIAWNTLTGKSNTATDKTLKQSNVKSTDDYSSEEQKVHSVPHRASYTSSLSNRFISGGYWLSRLPTFFRASQPKARRAYTGLGFYLAESHTAPRKQPNKTL